MKEVLITVQNGMNTQEFLSNTFLISWLSWLLRILTFHCDQCDQIQQGKDKDFVSDSSQRNHYVYDTLRHWLSMFYNVISNDQQCVRKVRKDQQLLQRRLSQRILKARQQRSRNTRQRNNQVDRQQSGNSSNQQKKQHQRHSSGDTVSVSVSVSLQSNHFNFNTFSQWLRMFYNIMVLNDQQLCVRNIRKYQQQKQQQQQQQHCYSKSILNDSPQMVRHHFIYDTLSPCLRMFYNMVLSGQQQKQQQQRRRRSYCQRILNERQNNLNDRQRLRNIPEQQLKQEQDERLSQQCIRVIQDQERHEEQRHSQGINQFNQCYHRDNLK
eukprot:Awhi_evm1s599